MKQEIRFNPRKDAFSVVSAIGKLLSGLDDGEYTLTVDKCRKKRSLDANAYFWSLLGKLSAVRGLPGTTELYRKYIMEVGVREVYCGKEEAVKKLADAWGKGHLGNIAVVKDSKLSGCKINPLIGSAGVSAIPMAARVSQKVGAEADPTNFLLMHAMGPNVAGVIGTAVAAGTFMAIFGV